MFLFNLCFIFDENENTLIFEPLLIKLASYLETLEIENEFLSNLQTKKKCKKIIQRIYLDLNTSDSSIIRIGNLISLKALFFI